jgi:mono/diheme cytochrome c family protein
MRRKLLLLLIPAALAAVIITVVALSAGGGTGADAATVARAEAMSMGRQVFTENCAGCHTLGDAGATGTVGPNLDRTKPAADRAAVKVRSGGGGMPAFRGRLDAAEIDAVAAYVAGASGADAGAQPVVGTFEPDDTELAGCATGDQACLEQGFGNKAYEEGPKAALAEFDRRIATEPEVERGCHRIAHAIGFGALARYGGDVPRSLAEGSASCWSGYYHGVLERSFTGVKRSELGTVSRELCEDPDTRRVTFVAYQCVHGLGHGLMITTGYDLTLALKTCDALATAWDQSSCTGGVFMENLSSSYGVESKWLKDSDLIYPCNAVAERHKLYCYLMVTSRILPEVGYDWDRAAALCRRAERAWVATCFQSLGRDSSGTNRQDPVRTRETCRAAGAYRTDCLYGAARDITSNDAHGRRAARMCAGAPAASRERCFEGIGTILGNLAPTIPGRRSLCAQVGRANLGPCLRGAGVTASS